MSPCVWQVQSEPHVTLYGLSRDDQRQLDFLINDDTSRQRWERVNTRSMASALATARRWPASAYGTRRRAAMSAARFSYTRIPSAEDFW